MPSGINEATPNHLFNYHCFPPPGTRIRSVQWTVNDTDYQLLNLSHNSYISGNDYSQTLSIITSHTIWNQTRIKCKLNLNSGANCLSNESFLIIPQGQWREVL